MNIDDPQISRALAILIEPIVYEDRARFIRDAELSKSMEVFLKKMESYRRE